MASSLTFSLLTSHQHCKFATGHSGLRPAPLPRASLPRPAPTPHGRRWQRPGAGRSAAPPATWHSLNSGPGRANGQTKKPLLHPSCTAVWVWKAARFRQSLGSCRPLSTTASLPPPSALALTRPTALEPQRVGLWSATFYMKTRSKGQGTATPGSVRLFCNTVIMLAFMRS